MGDWAVFDLGLGVWIRLTVKYKDGTPFQIQRRMHTLTAVSSAKDSRLQTVQNTSDGCKAGFYMFGGQDE